MLKNILRTLIVYICLDIKYSSGLQSANNIIYHNLNNSSCTNEYCVNLNKSDTNLNNVNNHNNLIDYGTTSDPTAASHLLFSGNNLNINREHLRRTSVIYGLISISSNDLLSDACYTDLQRVFEGIHKKEVWAMKGNSIRMKFKLGMLKPLALLIRVNWTWLSPYSFIILKPFRCGFSSRFTIALRDYGDELLDTRPNAWTRPSAQEFAQIAEIHEMKMKLNAGLRYRMQDLRKILNKKITKVYKKVKVVNTHWFFFLLFSVGPNFFSL